MIYITLRSVCILQTDPGSYQHLVPGLVRLLGQVIGRRLVSDYDYHTVPAPWMTLVILRILAKLGAHDQRYVVKLILVNFICDYP